MAVKKGTRELQNALGPVGKRMAEKLERALAPSLLQVIDESHHHACIGNEQAGPQGHAPPSGHNYPLRARW